MLIIIYAFTVVFCSAETGLHDQSFAPNASEDIKKKGKEEKHNDFIK